MVGDIKLDLSMHCDRQHKTCSVVQACKRIQNFTLADADVAVLKKGHCALGLQCLREAEMIWSSAERDPGS